MAALNRGMDHRLGVDDHLCASLPPGAQVEMILVKLTQQAPTVHVESGLKLVVGERPGLFAGEEADEGAVDRIGAAEGGR